MEKSTSSFCVLLIHKCTYKFIRECVCVNASRKQTHSLFHARILDCLPSCSAWPPSTLSKEIYQLGVNPLRPNTSFQFVASRVYLHKFSYARATKKWWWWWLQRDCQPSAKTISLIYFHNLQIVNLLLVVRRRQKTEASSRAKVWLPLPWVSGLLWATGRAQRCGHYFWLQFRTLTHTEPWQPCAIYIHVRCVYII